MGGRDASESVAAIIGMRNLAHRDAGGGSVPQHQKENLN
jgi:hypothetical protein